MIFIGRKTEKYLYLVWHVRNAIPNTMVPSFLRSENYSYYQYASFVTNCRNGKVLVVRWWMQNKGFARTALHCSWCPGTRLTRGVTEGGAHAGRGHADGADLRLTHAADGFWHWWQQTHHYHMVSERAGGPQLRRLGVDTPALPPNPNPHRSALLVTTVNALLKCQLSTVSMNPTAHSVFSLPLHFFSSSLSLCSRLTFCQQ